MEKTELAEILKNFRIQNDLTQEAAGWSLGLPTRTIENIEYGRGFRHEKLLRLAMTAITDGGSEYESKRIN